MSAPESEDEKHQQHAEGGHIVHGLHQHHQLSPQGGQEAYKLEHPQQTKRPQDRQPAIRIANYLPHTENHKQQSLLFTIPLGKIMSHLQTMKRRLFFFFFGEAH